MRELNTVKHRANITNLFNNVAFILQNLCPQVVLAAIKHKAQAFAPGRPKLLFRLQCTEMKFRRAKCAEIIISAYQIQRTNFAVII